MSQHRAISGRFQVTLTSAVSLWQFLHEQPMPEKARSGWSNLLSLALRKNVVKGSCKAQDREKCISGEASGLWSVFKRLLGGGQRSQACEVGTYYSEHPHQRRVSCGVKGCVVVGRGAVVVPRLVALCVKRCSLGIQCSDWLEETSEKVVGGYTREARTGVLFWRKFRSPGAFALFF